MEISIPEISKADAYKLMNCMIVPRPIAWVTTNSRDGVTNLAPYSTFNIVCYDPPLLGMNIGQREDGTPKDSARNVREMGEMVVHIASPDLLDALHASSAAFPPGVSEAEHLGLALVPSVDISVPRLRDAALALECRLYRMIEFGPVSDFVVVQVVRVHAREGLVHDFKIDTQQLRPLSRLGGPVYGAIGEVFVKGPVAVP